MSSQSARMKCNLDIGVANTGKNFATTQTCHAQVPVGTDIQELMTLCMSCEHATTPPEQQPAAPAVPASVQTASPPPDVKPDLTPAASEPAPEPEPAPVPVEEATVPPPTPPVPTPVLAKALDPVLPAAMLPQATLPPPDAVAPPAPTATLAPPGVEMPVPAEHVEPTMPPPDAAAVAPALAGPPELGATDIVLPGGYTLVPEDESTVDIDAILNSIDGYKGGPSEGGLSSHILADAQACPRRCFYNYIQGVQKLKTTYHFSFGSLFHGVLAMRYLHGAERQYEPIEKAIQGGAAKMAKDCRVLVDGMIDKFGHEERETWCPRAVEENVTFHLPRQRINGKNVQIPICARIDLILALRKAGEAAPGLGPAPQGSYVVDHKTTGGATYDLVTGYGQDFQMKTYAMAYIKGGLEAVHGPFNGVMINLATKRKIPKPEHFTRARAPYSVANVDEFLNDEIIPAATWLYTMLTNPDTHNDEKCWPKRTTQCVSRWGACDYFEICDGGSMDDPSRFKRSTEHLLLEQMKTFVEPSKAGKKTATVLDQSKDEAKVAKDEMQAKLLNLYAQGLLTLLPRDDHAPLRKDQFLVPGHNKKGVESQLGAALKAFYLPYVEGKVKYDQDYTAYGIDGSVNFVYQKTGVKWTTGGMSARLTFKQIATEICAIEWFNLSRIQPEGLPSQTTVPPPA